MTITMETLTLFSAVYKVYLLLGFWLPCVFLKESQEALHYFDVTFL